MASETQLTNAIPRIVITPQRDDSRFGTGPDGTVGRTLPPEAQGRATVLGKSNTEAGGETGFWGTDGFSFGDLIDLVNPLQHIPGVSTVYRAITGDEIGIGPRLLGGAMLGGVVGFGIAASNAAVEYETGKDLGDHMLLAMGLTDEADVSVAMDDAPSSARTVLSSADPLGVMELEALPEIASTTVVDAAQEMTQEQQSILDLAQAGAGDAMLVPPAGAGQDPRAMFLLEGGQGNATRLYQQAQSLDQLQNVALHMDVEG
jgi:hypothetical protein